MENPDLDKYLPNRTISRIIGKSYKNSLSGVLFRKIFSDDFINDNYVLNQSVHIICAIEHVSLEIENSLKILRTFGHQPMSRPVESIKSISKF